MLRVRHTVRKTVLRALCGAVCVLCQHAAEKLHASGTHATARSPPL